MGNSMLWWFGLGGVLLILELLAPGASLLWLGVAALLTGATVWLVPDLSLISQALVFGVFASFAVAVYWKWFRVREPATDRPLLNQRSAQWLGQEFELSDDLTNGHGKCALGDTVWSIRGPDLARGTRVRVEAVEGNVLRVIAANRV
jgi:inner membrane protein